MHFGDFSIIIYETIAEQWHDDAPRAVFRVQKPTYSVKELAELSLYASRKEPVVA